MGPSVGPSWRPIGDKLTVPFIVNTRMGDDMSRMSFKNCPCRDKTRQQFCSHNVFGHFVNAGCTPGRGNAMQQRCLFYDGQQTVQNTFSHKRFSRYYFTYCLCHTSADRVTLIPSRQTTLIQLTRAETPSTRFFTESRFILHLQHAVGKEGYGRWPIRENAEDLDIERQHIQ